MSTEIWPSADPSLGGTACSSIEPDATVSGRARLTGAVPADVPLNAADCHSGEEPERKYGNELEQLHPTPRDAKAENKTRSQNGNYSDIQDAEGGVIESEVLAYTRRKNSALNESKTTQKPSICFSPRS